jgi:hypothetical protein
MVVHKSMTNVKYTVWCHVNGVVWFPLIHRKRTEWTLKTAVRLAENYADTFKCTCKVLRADSEFVE